MNNVKIIRGSIKRDIRGQIWTSWEKKKTNINFNHDKFSFSKKNVFRGFHFDYKTYKLVSCVFGEVIFFYFNTKNKKKFNIKKKILNLKRNIQIFLPPNYAIGFLCLSEKCIFHYKLYYKGKYIDSKNQNTIKLSDKRINLQEIKKKNLILSKRDF